MSSPAVASSVQGDQELAWDRHAMVQERAGALIACQLILVLFPLWSLFDYGLQPALATRFLVIRLCVAALAAVVLVIQRRSARTAVTRAAMLAAGAATGIAIAYFVAFITDHYVLYCLGFSLVFWGLGPLLAWPWVYTAACYVMILAVHVALRIAGEQRAADGTAFYGVLAYLGSAAVIATGISIVRRRLEYQAFVASHALEVKNRELASALATLRDAQERFVATEKLSALGRLIAQLSHEINNPVNVLQNNLDPVREHLANIDEVLELARTTAGDGGALEQRWRELDLDFVRADIKDAISTMVNAAERIRTIQSDMRSFLRGDASAPTEADFNAGVRSTVAMLKRHLPANTQLVESYGELPPARFHVGQLSQVTLNLVQNALDAVAARGGTVEVATRHDGGDVVLTVSDTGPGVAESARRHLFEPFYTTKAVGKGTGLGLATCYQIVHAHRGSIALDEDYANGARFVVRLPTGS